MTFTAEELLYISKAVNQYDGEYDTAPGDLLERLQTWKEDAQAGCQHIRTWKRGGHLMRDGLYSWTLLCTDCGRWLDESEHA